VHHIAWGTARAARDQMDQNPAVEAANMYDYHWDVLPKTIWYLYIYMTLAYCDTYHGIYIYNILVYISIVMYSIGFAHPHVATLAQSHHVSSGKASKPQICIKYPNPSQRCI
jgi:hypothetical protein